MADESVDMLNEQGEVLKKIKKELDNCSRPLFFFDDDADGLSSFLLFYRYKQAGKGVVVKTYPVLDEKFLNTVRDYSPDKIFILDIPNVSDGFLDKISVPVIYIDHHDAKKHEEIIYFNPHNSDEKDDRCVSYWCYNIINEIYPCKKDACKKDAIDIWIAMVGCIGDWFLPDFKDEFIVKYPKMLNKKINKPEGAMFNSRIGNLVKIFSFVLKGDNKAVMSCIKVLTRINNPEEIIDQTTSQGRFIYKRFEKVNQQYEELINSISERNIEGNFLTFFYTEKQWSFTSDISNELLYRYPDKIIIIGREKSGEIKCSIRSNKYKLPEKIKNALKACEGYGGGHDYACGACVKEKDFKKFLEQFKNEFK